MSRLSATKIFTMKKLTLLASAVGIGAAIYFVQVPENQTSLPPANLEFPSSLNEPSTIASTPEIAAANGFNLDLKNKSTIFLIDPSKSQTITGPEGTIITFPENSFVDKNGNRVISDVKINLLECYDIAAMIGSKLSTTSNGRLLETAGMVDIQASVNGEEIFLANDIRYDIQFPKKEEKEGFKLFYGQRDPQGQINWIEDPAASIKATTANAEIPTSTSTPSTASPDNCFIQINKSNFRRNNKVAEMDYFNWKLVDGSSFQNYFTANFNPPLEMVNEFCTLKHACEVTIKLDEQSRVKHRHINHSATAQWDKVILDFIDNLPPLDVRRYMETYDEDHAIILRFGNKNRQDESKELAKLEKAIKTNEDEEVISVKKDALSYYCFASAKLGWINCDRYIEEESDRGSFFVSCPNATETEMYIALKKYDGLLVGTPTSSGFHFNDVPRNLQIKIIAVTASNEQPGLATKASNTKTKGEKIDTFKPFTLVKLKHELASI